MFTIELADGKMTRVKGTLYAFFMVYLLCSFSFLFLIVIDFQLPKVYWYHLIVVFTQTKSKQRLPRLLTFKREKRQNLRVFARHSAHHQPRHG